MTTHVYDHNTTGKPSFDECSAYSWQVILYLGPSFLFVSVYCGSVCSIVFGFLIFVYILLYYKMGNQCVCL